MNDMFDGPNAPIFDPSSGWKKAHAIGEAAEINLELACTEFDEPRAISPVVRATYCRHACAIFRMYQ
jgi:hypothetical protein